MDEFIKLKLLEENKYLDENTLNFFTKFFNITEDPNDFEKLKPLNNLKTIDKEQLKKTIHYKVTLILNKLTKDNINNLLSEFVNNIGKVDANEFNEILKSFYLKIINDIKFIDIYLIFLKKILYLYNKNNDYDYQYLINILEYKFIFLYMPKKYKYIAEYSFLENDKQEDNRIYNLMLIKSMVNEELLNTALLDVITNILLDMPNFYIDLYKLLENTKLAHNIKEQLLNIIKTSDNIRCITLFEKLINN